MSRRQYTDREKAEYYKRKAASLSGSMSRMRVSGKGSYTINRIPPGRSRVTGRGAYKFPKGYFAQKGSVLGSALGGAIAKRYAPGISSEASNLGRRVGIAAGKLLSKVVGSGDYEVKENSLLFPDRIVPTFGDDSIRVRKREMIGHINASSVFQNNTFAINPGLSETFPWLSAIAQNYEQYRFNGLIFQFRSTSSDAIASTTDLGLGQVILATDYNAADPPFVNDIQMLGSMFANSGKPSVDILHAIECASPDQAQKLYYIRTGDIPVGTDIRLYDLGTFQLATDNMPADYDGMGQLWVTYDITFCKSVMNNQIGYAINSDLWYLVSCTTTNPFGTLRTEVTGSNIGLTVIGDKVSFPPQLESGIYQVTYFVQGSSASLVLPTVTFANCGMIAGYFNNNINSVTNAATTSTDFYWTFFIRLLGRDATFSFSGGTLPAATANGTLVVTQVNGMINQSKGVVP